MSESPEAGRRKPSSQLGCVLCLSECQPMSPQVPREESPVTATQPRQAECTQPGYCGAAGWNLACSCLSSPCCQHWKGQKPVS